MSSIVIPFDTLSFAKELESAGVPSAQAEAQAKAMAMVIRQMDARVDDLAARREKQAEDRFDSLADRNDQQVKGRLDGLATRQELDSKLKELELRMVIKMGAMIIGGIGLLFGLMRIWPLPVQYVAPPAQELRLPAPPPAR
ncbi:MAG: CCDC90 family protein [Magnetococcus sp. YQC-9]